MTQTGGLAVLAAWLLFAAALGVLTYWVLRAERDPFDDLHEFDRSASDAGTRHERRSPDPGRG